MPLRLKNLHDVKRPGAKPNTPGLFTFLLTLFSGRSRWLHRTSTETDPPVFLGHAVNTGHPRAQWVRATDRRLFTRTRWPALELRRFVERGERNISLLNIVRLAAALNADATN